MAGGTRLIDKEVITSLSGTDRLVLIRPGAPTGTKEKSILVSNINTDNLAEGLANLYFTESRVLDSILTGFTPVNSAIVDTDSVFEALEKAQGQIDDIITDSPWEQTTSYLKPKNALGVNGIRLYNAGLTHNVKISYESNGIYYDSSDPTQIHRFWQGLQAETYIKLNNGAGSLSASTGIQYYFNDVNYRFGFDDTGGTGKFRINIPTATAVYSACVTAGALASNNIVWSVDGLGAMYLKGTFNIGSVSPPGNPAAGVYIYNASDTVYSRDTAGNVQNLAGQNPPRLISAADSNRVTDEIVCLDTTLSSFIFEIDMDKLKRPLTVVVSTYVNTGQIRAKSGQFINGSAVAINIPAGAWSVLTIMPSATANNMFISNTA